MLYVLKIVPVEYIGAIGLIVVLLHCNFPDIVSLHHYANWDAAEVAKNSRMNWSLKLRENKIEC